MRPVSADSPPPDGWIGVDLNTTGYIAVVAHPASGGVVMLGEQPEDAGIRERGSSAGKHKKLKEARDRESSVRGGLNRRIAREIVKMARHLQCGIKLEDLSGAGFAGRQKPGVPLPFSRRDGSFYHLQNLVEARAHDAGVPVVLVDPALTSRCCSRCGERGIRRRKQFLCPHCGYTDHADANAAFNIAAAPGTGRT
ncbi:transposase [Methanoculleus sp. 10]|jgi:IS605 OrfB family transposase|uniref:transposase n=1 Tax=Methanoculleus sp. 10 TaxID=430615 RepID=UPI001B7327BA|nr:transposase [Methanoculleus sp. 10]MBP7411601.1 transposase [Methanoculleus sp.]